MFASTKFFALMALKFNLHRARPIELASIKAHRLLPSAGVRGFSSKFQVSIPFGYSGAIASSSPVRIGKRK